MKRKIIILASVLVVALIGIWGWRHDSQKKATAIDECENQIKEYELSMQAAQAQLDNMQSENEKLQDENEKLKEETDSILVELENKTLEMQELKNEIQYIYMGAASGQLVEQVFDGKYMTAEKVPIRRMPSDNKLFYSPNELSYYMVNPIAVVSNYVDENVTEWVFVNFLTIGELADNHGWVKFSELIKYTEDTRPLLQGPFVLSEDAVDVHTGEAVDVYLRGSEVNAQFKEGYVSVVTAGGISADVDEKYLIYPKVK